MALTAAGGLRELPVPADYYESAALVHFDMVMLTFNLMRKQTDEKWYTFLGNSM